MSIAMWVCAIGVMAVIGVVTVWAIRVENSVMKNGFESSKQIKK